MKLFESRKEFLIVLLIAVGAVSFSLLPTIYAWLSTPEGYWFTGVSSYFDPWDINAYFATMRRGVNGSWLYRDPYTPDDTRLLPTHLVYLSLGHLARIFNLPIPFVYHLASFVLGIIFLLVVYLFIRFFLRDRFWSLFCLFLISFGGGFGFVGIFEGKLLPDAAWPDATVFPTLHLPHFILDQLLFLAVLFFSYQALTKRSWRCGFLTAALGLGLSFIHPYSLFVAAVVAVVIFVGLWLRDRNWRRAKFLFPLLFAGVVLGGYFFQIFYLDNSQADSFFVSQPEYQTPSILVLTLGYGLVAVLAAVGVYRLGKEKSPAAFFLLPWFLGQLLVLYLPVTWQRIMIKSFFIVVCLLAVWGMRAWGLRKNWMALAMILFFSVLTNLFIQTYTVITARAGNEWVYLTSEEHGALEWLRENSSGGIVLAPLNLATMVPANSNNMVYLSYQTTHFRPGTEEEGLVESFYRGDLPPPPEFLRGNQIDYVIVDNDKSVLEETEYLEEVYENGKVKIYEVL